MHRIELFEGSLRSTSSVEDLKISMMENSIQFLKAWGVSIERHRLQDDPQAFENEAVRTLLQAQGESALPITLVDGAVAKSGEYPTSNDLVQFSGFEEEEEDDCGCGCDHEGEYDCGCEHGEDCDCCDGHHHHH